MAEIHPELVGEAEQVDRDVGELVLHCRSSVGALGEPGPLRLR